MLLHNDDIRQVAVVGGPDAVYDQEVVAVVVPDWVVAWSRERCGAHKYPRCVELVNAVALGLGGKVLKRQLRDSLR